MAGVRLTGDTISMASPLRGSLLSLLFPIGRCSCPAPAVSLDSTHCIPDVASDLLAFSWLTQAAQICGPWISICLGTRDCFLIETSLQSFVITDGLACTPCTHDQDVASHSLLNSIYYKTCYRYSALTVTRRVEPNVIAIYLVRSINSLGNGTMSKRRIVSAGSKRTLPT